MARYTKVTKKKEKKNEPLLLDEAVAVHWLSESAGQLMLGVGGIILLVALVYGFVYYQKTSARDAEAALYRAVSSAPASGANRQQGEEVIAQLRALITKGGSAQTVAHAHLELAALLGRTGDHAGAAAEYGIVVDQHDKSSVLYGLALAGKAKELVRSNDYSKSVATLEAIVSSNSPYASPEEALITLTFLHAAAGEKGNALATLERLKSRAPSSLNPSYMNDLTRRIEGNELIAPPLQPTTVHSQGSLADQLNGTAR